MDLLDWHRGAVSSRRLAVLVKHLPRDSAVNRDLHGEAVEWDASTHLLAATVDHLAVANWMTATINSGEDAEPLEYPEAVPRPGPPESSAVQPQHGDEPRESELPDPEQLARFFS
ncbi:hypothetical protein [Streptomyces sp. SDr-06]|uniref:hypothetical protein n=1 Tax=Streptomyces sp. SDr-06 TaxID=2267702 RepID=UPI000DEAA9CE|nr:hypothetical protein [Streptomyces sp. SDr-06]RCH68209.1 hypothetical protein DT019_14625 [Streptomyces sp. SDr-06]